MQRKSFRIIDIFSSRENTNSLEIATGVLVTLVHTEGSCYQKAGAQLFLSSENEVYGLISGGCLEHDIVEQAKEVQETKLSRLAYFDTGDPFDIDFGFGLGCGGKLWIFIEWIKCRHELHGKIISLSSQICAEAIVVEANQKNLIGQRFFLRPDDNQPSACLPHIDLLDELKWVLLSKKSQMKHLHNSESSDQASLTVAFLYRSAQPVLTIFGCGLGAWPLATMTTTLGWELRAYDHRRAYLDDLPEQLAIAELLDWKEEAPFQSNPCRPSAAVIMTHNFHADRRILTQLLSHHYPWNYIGLLGSQSRSQHLFQEIFQHHPKLKNSPNFASLHAPIGLDLGGSTPEAIALAISSEIQAVIHQRQQISYRSKMSFTQQGNYYVATY